MKKVFLSIVAIAALVALPMSVSAQEDASTTGTGKARILIPIGLAKEGAATLDFGTILSNNAAFTVKADASTSTFGDYTGGATFFDGTQTFAEFKVSGTVGQSYSVTFDATVTLTPGTNASGIVTLTGFNTSLTDDSGSISATASENIFKVGALLSASAGATGNFEHTFPVTVTYE